MKYLMCPKKVPQQKTYIYLFLKKTFKTPVVAEVLKLKKRGFF
jgi:hypothetical protein